MWGGAARPRSGADGGAGEGGADGGVLVGRRQPAAGDGLTDDILLRIARSLLTARDLVALQLTCPRFASKVIAVPPSVGAGGAAAAPEMLCIAEEAGRLWVAGCSEQERGWVPRAELESLLGLMHEVAVLLAPLLFGRVHDGSFTLSEGGTLATRNTSAGCRTAASKVVMRSGRHFVRFTLVERCDMFFGVIRSGWDVEEGDEADVVHGHCFYSVYNGKRYPGMRLWEGMQHAREQGDRIDMLLDLDQGSMTVWKNDERLGVMQAEGLSGPYCWASRYTIRATACASSRRRHHHRRWRRSWR